MGMGDVTDVSASSSGSHLFPFYEYHSLTQRKIRLLVLNCKLRYLQVLD